MTRRRAAVATTSLLFGVATVLIAIYRVWRPTVTDPNYWVSHTGGLPPLVLLAAFGGVFVIGGFALEFDTVLMYLRGVGVQNLAVMAIAGGLLGYEPINRMLARTAGGGALVYYGVHAAAFALLSGGVAVIAVRYRPLGRRGRYGAGVLAGGFLLLAGAELLSWGLTAVEPRTGALSYPPLGLVLVGTLALTIGSILLGISLRNHDNAPGWLGLLIVTAGLLATPLGVVGFLQYEWASGLYGLTWVIVGALLLAERPLAAHRIR